jgi:hypothetical protein
MTVLHVGLSLNSETLNIPALSATSEQQRNWVEELDRRMRREIRLQRMACEEVWYAPLAKRVEQGHSLGPLTRLSLLDCKTV